MTVSTILAPNDPFFANAPFDWDGRLFTTVPEFELFLAQPTTLDKLRWAKRVTVHHTWLPTVDQWIRAGGRRSLQGVIETWRDKNGWSTGPNMIIAPEGIYLASGVDGPGIHATVCNGDGIGIEVVGNYDEGYWPEPIRTLVFGATIALSRALGNSASDVVQLERVNGHRECNSPKTCPGSKIDLDKFRRDVAFSLQATKKRIDVQVIGVPPSITQRQFNTYVDAHSYPGRGLSGIECVFVYEMCVRLEVDPAFMLAIARHEAGAQLVGSPLQLLSNMPTNIRALPNLYTLTVEHPTKHGQHYLRFQAPQLGWAASVLDMKNRHGWAGRVTVATIIPEHTPEIDVLGDDIYIAKTLERMQDMQRL